MSGIDLMQGFPPSPAGQVTLANWRKPLFNRWSFQHVSTPVGFQASVAERRRPVDCFIPGLMGPDL